MRVLVRVRVYVYMYTCVCIRAYVCACMVGPIGPSILQNIFVELLDFINQNVNLSIIIKK